MTSSLVNHANYNRPNPHIRCGASRAPLNPAKEVRPTIRVLLPWAARPVSTFPLTMTACRQLALKAVSARLSAHEIHKRLSAGQSVRVRWHGGEIAVLKV